MIDYLYDVRWFFEKTFAWVWGHDLHSAAHLMGVKRLPVYGIRLGSWALYAVRLTPATHAEGGEQG